MSHSSHCIGLGLALGLALVCGPPADAASAIDTTNAQISAGTGAPAGVVEIDPAAPETLTPGLPSLGVLGSIGTITGALPAFPGSGTGVDGAFAAAADMSIPGGTFNFSSYTVTAGATVDYTTAAIIHVTGAINIDGRVRATASGVGIEFRGGGDFTVVSNTSPPNDIRVDGDGADLTVHAAGDVSLGSGGTSNGVELWCVDGTLTIVAHGTVQDGGDIVTDRIRAVGMGPGVTFQAAQSIQFGAGSVSSGGGDTLAQAFGMGLTSATHFSAGAGSIRLEAAQGLSFTNGSVDSSSGDVSLRALAGDVTLTSSTVEGEVTTVHASGAARMLDGSDLAGGTALHLVAFGGDAVVGDPASRVCCIEGAGDQTVSASNDVVFGNGAMDSSNGALTLRAFGGTAHVLGDSSLESSNGPVDVRATTAIAIDTNGTCIDGGSVFCSAGAGGVNVTSSEFLADDAGLEVLTTGPVRLRTSVDAITGVTIRSTGGDIDIAGADIGTRNQNANPSGDVLIEGWLPACILAADSVVESGNSPAASGDVRLLLHGAAAPEPEEEVRSFFLPKTVRVKLNANKPEKSKLNAAGFFDVGPGNPDFIGAATLDVGDLSVKADLEVRPNGRVFSLKADGFDFRITRAKSGSSRAKFRLTIVRDLAGSIPTEGDIELRFRIADIEGSGTVALERGKYKLGRKRGTLTEPIVFPFKAKATILGGGRDKLALLAGIATADDPPVAAPETTISFGTFTMTVPTGEFTDRGNGVFEAKNPTSAPGVKKLTIDFLREIVSLKAAGVDLGAIALGPFDVVMGVTLGEEERTVQVTAVRAKKKVSY